MPDFFPRGTDIPSQSPLFWVSQKDRYLRQLLIRDIEAITGRRLLVYFTDCAAVAQIDGFDCKYITELLGSEGLPFDLLLETNGGQTDATENLVSILSKGSTSFRVIVPARAKSNGTLIALASDEILMGNPSELGPVDPNLVMGNQMIPCSFIISAANAGQPVDPIMLQFALAAINQTMKLAETVLAQRMLKGTAPDRIKTIVNDLATRQKYYSHGSVIDSGEAASLGLKVQYLRPNDDLWQKIWLLRCMYEFDARMLGVAKMYESVNLSHSIKIAPPVL
ncbi:hypothetical protein [Armatimonas sp.]|uniref:SDH family Clp fold serine proteinase n=1 Tax=Armatimonas sp. TaxID=1872638 RepID=UPI003751ED07